MRWPNVVGLEQIFQDMQIEEQTAFGNIQETRVGTYESLESDNSGNNKLRLIMQKEL